MGIKTKALRHYHMRDYMLEALHMIEENNTVAAKRCIRLALKELATHGEADKAVDDERSMSTRDKDSSRASDQDAPVKTSYRIQHKNAALDRFFATHPETGASLDPTSANMRPLMYATTPELWSHILRLKRRAKKLDIATTYAAWDKTFQTLDVCAEALANVRISRDAKGRYTAMYLFKDGRRGLIRRPTQPHPTEDEQALLERYKDLKMRMKKT